MDRERGWRVSGIALVSVFALLSVAPSAEAAVTLGKIPADFGSGGQNCSHNKTYVQTGGAFSYAAPTDGVLTSWVASGIWADSRLKVLRPSGTNTYAVLSQDGPYAAPPTPTIRIPHNIRIPVRQGDTIAVYVSAFARCIDGFAGTDVKSSAGDPAPGSQATFGTPSTGQVPVEASLELDADADGFGDETQDGCPSLASTQGPCPLPPPPDTTPPETMVDRGPGKKTKSKTAKFQFSSSEQGSTFECSVDGAQFTACSSPMTIKVKPGRHNFLVRARDGAGNLDTSEAGYSWVTKKKKRGKR